MVDGVAVLEILNLSLDCTASLHRAIAMEGVDDEENANLLQFGEEHSKDDMSCLSNAEVSMVLEKQRGAYEEKDINVTP